MCCLANSTQLYALHRVVATPVAGLTEWRGDDVTEQPVEERASHRTCRAGGRVGSPLPPLAGSLPVVSRAPPQVLAACWPRGQRVGRSQPGVLLPAYGGIHGQRRRVDGGTRRLHTAPCDGTCVQVNAATCVAVQCVVSRAKQLPFLFLLACTAAALLLHSLTPLV